MNQKKTPEPKPLFVERMKELLGNDFESYLEILKREPVRSIRANKLKISPEELKKRLEKKGWKINQPFKEHKEIMVVEGKSISHEQKLEGRLNVKETLVSLQPGELGRTLEHLLGYYYIQELASMLPIIALRPEPNQLVLDLCSAPGSKTTQMAAEMRNTGTVIANEISLKRIKILASNMERCGVMNAIITKKEGLALCKKLKEANLKEVDGQGNLVPYLFDKILVDAPCSGEGTLRSSPKTYKMWNINTIRKLSRIQKSLLRSAIDILKPGGELVYSTCTHSPEENEEVIDSVLKEFRNKIKIEQISLPVQSRPGIKKWKDREYLEDVKLACRIYPQDNDTEGFFIAKFRRVK